MTRQVKPLTEITQQAIELLAKEMGLVDTVRFLNQCSAGYGDYTKKREALFDELTFDQILSEIKGARAAAGSFLLGGGGLEQGGG
jgi:hypothetical protein